MKIERYDIKAHLVGPDSEWYMDENPQGDFFLAEDVLPYMEKVEKLKEAAEGVLREAMFGKLLNVTDMQHVFAALAALEEDHE